MKGPDKLTLLRGVVRVAFALHCLRYSLGELFGLPVVLKRDSLIMFSVCCTQLRGGSGWSAFVRT